MGLVDVLLVIGGLLLPHAALRAAAALAGLSMPAPDRDHATGEVIAATDVRTSGLPPGTSVADVTFKVHLADGNSYVARSRVGFTAPDRRARITTLGTVLPLHVDRRDRSRVAVNVAALGIPVTAGPR
jgi:hypothetical protein